MSIEILKKTLANVCLDVVNDQVNGSPAYQDNIARLGAILLAFGAAYPEEFNEHDMADVANRQLDKLADNGIISEDDVSDLRYEPAESPEDATRGDDEGVEDSNDVEVKDESTTSSDNGQRRSAP